MYARTFHFDSNESESIARPSTSTRNNKFTATIQILTELYVCAYMVYLQLHSIYMHTFTANAALSAIHF